MGTGIDIGITGLKTAQSAMLTFGNNIVNANTPGFNKRTPILTTELPLLDVSGVLIGQGVRLEQIKRETVEFLNTRLLEKQSELSFAEVTDVRISDLEGIFNELSDFGLKNAISEFFNAIQEVSKNPEDLGIRTQLVEIATTMTQRFNQMGKDIDDMSTKVRDDIKAMVKEINNLTAKIADLNARISSLSVSGIPAHDLEDQRDALLVDLSKLIDTNVSISGDGTTRNVTFAGRNLVGGSNFLLLTTQTQPNGDVLVVFQSDSVIASPTSGALKGLLDFQTTANTFKGELDKLAKAMIDEVNRIHSEGVNLNGSFSAPLTSKNGLTSATAALNTTGLLPFTSSSGDIYVTVTNTSTGAVTQTKISVNVATDTLTSLATMLDAIADLSASVVTSGGLNFLEVKPTTSGFTFNFSRGLDPNPGSIGTATATIDGTYTGSNNDVYTFTAIDSGTVGSGGNLRIEVRNSGGQLLTTLDVGGTYKVGNTIEVIDGLKMTLGGGTITAGNSFSLNVINDPDTTNLFSALGINRFFSGSKSTDIAVDTDIKNDVSRIAAASSDSKGDNDNALRMAELRLKGTISGRTFGEFLAETSLRIGDEASRNNKSLQAQTSLLEALKSLKSQSVGVSVDEELTNLIRFEQMYMASVRFVTTLNRLIDRLVEL